MEAITLTLEKQDLACLGRCPLLRGVPEDGIARLLDEPGAELVSFSGGQVVYSPQHFSRRLGVLLSGSLQVTKGELTVSCLEPGELFGAAALFNDRPDYATTLTARTPCRVLLLPQALVEELMGRFPEVCRSYVAYLSERIRFLSGKIDALTAGSAERKVAQYLLSRLDGEWAELDCSATGLAQRLGVSRASLYRALDALEARGAVRRAGKRFRIPDPAALESC